VYPATMVGVPSIEDFYIGGVSVKLFLPIFKMNFPEIVDIQESQRDSVPKPRVARHELPWVSVRKIIPTALRLRLSIPARAHDKPLLHMQQRFAGQLFGFERA